MAYLPHLPLASAVGLVLGTCAVISTACSRRTHNPVCVDSLALRTAPESVSSTTTAPPTGPEAYPPLGSCDPTEAPELPATWSTSALLTNFEWQTLRVARMSTEAKGKSNRTVITVGDVDDDAGIEAWFIDGNHVYALSNGADGALQCEHDEGRVNAWKAIDLRALLNSKCECKASTIVTGEVTQAWMCPQENDYHSWIWFAKHESDPVPVRIINPDPGSIYDHIPIIGDASLINFAEFTMQADPLLDVAARACLEAETVQFPLQTPTISGLSYAAKTDQPPPPTWPNTAFTNGVVFSATGDDYSLAVYYDWVHMQSLSSFRKSDGSMIDDYLTKGETYEYNLRCDGRQNCAQHLSNVGVWHPRWAHIDDCEYKATMAANSALNPYEVDMQAIACHFSAVPQQHASYIQAWYLVDERPIMFYETKASSLALVDYYDWIPNAMIPEGLRATETCEAPVQQFDNCNACHTRAPDEK